MNSVNLNIEESWSKWRDFWIDIIDEVEQENENFLEESTPILNLKPNEKEEQFSDSVASKIAVRDE